VCAALVVVAVAGCGSSSSSSSTTSTATFLAEANGACRTAYAKVNALRPAKAGQETLAETKANVPKLAVIAQSMLVRLTALTPPPTLQGEYSRMLAAWRNEIPIALVGAQAAAAGNKKRDAETKTEIERLSGEFDDAAGKVGLTVCAGTP